MHVSCYRGWAVGYTIATLCRRTSRIWMAMKALCIGTALALLLPSAQAATEDDATPPGLSAPVAAPQSAPPTPAVEAEAKTGSNPKRADFAKEQASREARQLADWIVHSGDNKNTHFAIIDKKSARLFVFEASGSLQGASNVLLGAARGDHTVAGIGDKKLS